jgi:uncharacterized protein YkwD
MRFFLAALLSGAIATVAQAQGAPESQMLTLISQARARGCSGHTGVDAPLHWSAELARAAPHMEKGEAALAAAEKEGYRATRVFHADFSAYRTSADVVGALAQFYCSTLTDPKFTDIGLHHAGSTWLVVIAARLKFPELADGRAVAAKVLALTNEARSHARDCGDRAFAPAPPLRMNEQLEQAAAAYAKDMAQHQYLEHTGRDGSTPAQRISRRGYNWRAVGENIADGQFSPEQVVEDWISSPGHCANLMDADYLDMGVAFAINMASRPVVYWAQEFVPYPRG